MKNEHIEETVLEQLLLKVSQNEIKIEQIEQFLNDIKLRNRKTKNMLAQLNREDQCTHDWVGLHGHPAAMECKKCNKIEKAI